MPLPRIRHLQPLEDPPPLFDDRSPDQHPSPLFADRSPLEADRSPLEAGPSPLEAGPSPVEPGHPSTTLSPVEDECFSEWLAVEQRAANRPEGGLWDEPRWQEPPARLFERLAGRLRRKRTTG